MEWLNAVAPLVPVLVDLAKDAWQASKGNEDVAKGILLGIIGATEENKTRAAIVIANIKAMQEFGPN